MYTQEQRSYLLSLARTAIEHYPDTQPRPRPSDKHLSEPRGVFVTLTLHGELRGCIGSILPEKPLCQAVQDHAIQAAYHDPRFPPLSKHEQGRVRIEISVLSLPEPVNHHSPQELLDHLDHAKGLILAKGFRSATFLPQVWEQLPEKEQFLQHLCLKAGLHADAWQDPSTTCQTYSVEAFSEDAPVQG